MTSPPSTSHSRGFHRSNSSGSGVVYCTPFTRGYYAPALNGDQLITTQENHIRDMGVLEVSYLFEFTPSSQIGIGRNWPRNLSSNQRVCHDNQKRNHSERRGHENFHWFHHSKWDCVRLRGPFQCWMIFSCSYNLSRWKKIPRSHNYCNLLILKMITPNSINMIRNLIHLLPKKSWQSYSFVSRILVLKHPSRHNILLKDLHKILSTHNAANSLTAHIFTPTKVRVHFTSLHFLSLWRWLLPLWWRQQPLSCSGASFNTSTTHP